MATKVKFRRPADDTQDLSSWFSGKTYTMESLERCGRIYEATLTETLDAAAKTALTADLRDEVTDPVTYS